MMPKLPTIKTYHPKLKDFPENTFLVVDFLKTTSTHFIEAFFEAVAPHLNFYSSSFYQKCLQLYQISKQIALCHIL